MSQRTENEANSRNGLEGHYQVNSIGFVGTGVITEAMVRGLLAEPAYASQIHVSPRSAHIAETLAGEFAAVRIAKDNQDVVDRSDTVFLAIRPQIAEEVVRELSFRAGQTVVSVVAATERQALIDWIGADVHLVQAIPLPFVAARQGVTAIYPPDNTVAALSTRSVPPSNASRGSNTIYSQPQVR